MLIDVFIYRVSTTDRPRTQKICLYYASSHYKRNYSFIHNAVTFHREITLVRDKLHWKDDFHANRQTVMMTNTPNWADM